jgi:hypothetical protein
VAVSSASSLTRAKADEVVHLLTLTLTSPGQSAFFITHGADLAVSKSQMDQLELEVAQHTT